MEIGSAILGYLGALAARSLVLALAGGAAIVLLRLRSAAARHAMWTLVTAGMLALAIAGPLLPRVSWRVLPAEKAVVVTQGAAVEEPVAMGQIGDRQRNAPNSGAYVVPSPRFAAFAVRWQDAAAATYGVVALVWLAFLAASYRFTRRLVRAATRVELPGEVYESAWISVPVTAGFRNPKILLPANWREWPEGHLDAVLAHERTHIARVDWAVAVAAGINRCLFWFHPLTWWLERRLAALAEEACDDAALLETGRRESYAETLLDMAAAVRNSRGRMVWEAMSMAKTAEVKARIERILDETRQIPQGWTRSRWLVLLGCAAPLIYLTSAVQLAPAQEVRLSTDQISQMEQTLRRNPEDLETRSKLIANYFLTGTRQPRLDHILWLIQHHPESQAAVYNSAGILPSQGNDYSRAAALWREAAAQRGREAAVLANAAEFFTQPGADPYEAERVLRAGASLEPGNAVWTMKLARLYETAIRVTAGTGPESQTANAAFASHVESVLENSSDNLLRQTVATALRPYGRAITLKYPGLGPMIAVLEPGRPSPTFQTTTTYNPAQNQYVAPRAAQSPQLPANTPRFVARSTSLSDVTVRRDSPDYPEEAKSAGVEGDIHVRVRIGADGRAISAQAVDGNPMLAAAAQDMMMRRQYPGQAPSGPSAETGGILTVSYRLGDSGPPYFRPQVKDDIRPGTALTMQPVLLYKKEPEYTEEARQAKLQGTVVLRGVVGANGQVQDLTVMKSLGMGLDQKAMEAVWQWKFRPSMQNGQPVDAPVTLEVNFRLLTGPVSAAPPVLAATPGAFDSPPVLLWRKEPDYTEEARKAKYQGTVVLYVTIGTNGSVGNVRVLKSLGLGLDEKAVEAVKQWRFRPAMKNGAPVEAASTVEIDFRLL